MKEPWFSRIRRLDTSRLVVVAAAVEMFQGLGVYLVPQEFRAPVYGPLRALLPYFSTSLVAGGTVLLASGRYALAPWLRRALFVLPAAPLLVLAWLFTLARVWTGTILYGLLALAILTVPWLGDEEGRPPGPDLAAVTLALIEGGVGGLMLLVPGAFSAPYYDPIRELLPVTGLSGIGGAAVLIVSVVRGSRPAGRAARLAGALLPLFLVYSLGRTEVWTGVAAWGTWALALLLGERVPRPRSHRDEVPAADEPARTVERLLETWTWLLALAVVGVSALGGVAAVATPLVTGTFVVATSTWNALFHVAIPHVGTPQQRVYWHLAFLTGAVGFLLAGAGYAAHGFLTLLAATPVLATRVLGFGAGTRILGLGLAAVLLEEAEDWLTGGQTLATAMGTAAVNALILAAAAGVGMRSAEQQRRLLGDVEQAHARLGQAYADLQAANEELVAQQEELVAQQQAIQDQNEELLRQREQLEARKDQLEAALASLREETDARSRLAAILEETTDLVVTMGPTGQVLYWNRAAARLRGLGGDPGVGGRRFFDEQPAGTREQILGEAIPAAVRDGIWHGEATFVAADGQEIPVSVVVLAHRARGDGVEFLSVVARDIRDLKHAEAVLRRNLALEQTLRAIDEALIHERDVHEILRTVCDGVAALGYAACWVGLTGPDGEVRTATCCGWGEEETVTAPAASLLRATGPEQREDSVVRMPLESAGEVLGFLAVRDAADPGDADPERQRALEILAQHATLALVSARRREALEHWRQEAVEAGQRFYALAEAAVEGIVMTDAARHITYCNPAAAQMFGYGREELPGRPLAELLPSLPEDAWHWESEGLHRDGRRFPVEGSTSRIEGKSSPFFTYILRDLTERRRFEAQILYLADHDPLTRLFNRRRFEEELARHLAEARRYASRGALLFVDLDDFKAVNDELGHRAGDEVLTGVARALEEQLRETDIPARLGGDEFAVLLPQADREGAQAVAERIVDAVKDREFRGAGHRIRLTLSVGIALFPEHGTTVEELLAHADQAMYEAKENGGNACRFYGTGRDRLSRSGPRRIWEDQLREALQDGRFVLFCQPVADLRTGDLAMYELLLRMVGTGGETVTPDAFLDVAERSGLIHAIDRWVVGRAVGLLAAQHKAGRRVRLAVNVSGTAFQDRGLLSVLAQELAATGARAGDLTVEITETAAITDVHAARRFVRSLKQLGARVALDDFGAGFSSLHHLKNLPVDCLKIDGSFIQNLLHDPVDQQLVRTLADTARRLGLETVAEFVEDGETARLLREYGIRYAQGHFFGRPRPVAEVLGMPGDGPVR